MTKNPEIGSYIDYISDFYLSVRLRSEKELRDYLVRKLKRYDIDADEVGRLISEKMASLRKYDLVNDLRFAKIYVNEKSRLKQRGEYRIKLELRKKGISDEIIEHAFLNREEADSDILSRLLKTRYRNTDWSDPLSKKKAVSGLLRRGFGFSQIKKSIEEYSAEE